MTKELKLTKRRKLLGAVVICVALITGSTILWQMGQVAEATILTPYNFYDDFSGDLSQWTVMSGTWAIEGEELIQGATLSYPNCIAGSNWSNFTAEVKMRNIDSVAIALITRYVDENNYVTVYYYFAGNQKDKIAVWERVDGTWNLRGAYTFAKTAQSDVWYTLRVSLRGAQIKVYLDGDLIVTDSSIVAQSGKIGLTSFYGQASFDNVSVSSASLTEFSGTYGVNIRAGVTQIVITCTWSGSGDILMKLASPTATYYESDMSMYEKTTVSNEGTIISIFNIKRAAVSIARTTSSEVWTLHLELSNVTAYQVSVETT